MAVPARPTLDKPEEPRDPKAVRVVKIPDVVETTVGDGVEDNPNRGLTLTNVEGVPGALWVYLDHSRQFSITAEQLTELAKQAEQIVT